MKNDWLFDVIIFGCFFIDLYFNDLGVVFEEISVFGVFVGGFFMNIVVGSCCLGLKIVLLIVVGVDKVGDFIKNFLEKEGIEIKYIFIIVGICSFVVVLGIELLDCFLLVFYWDNVVDL